NLVRPDRQITQLPDSLCVILKISERYLSDSCRCTGRASRGGVPALDRNLSPVEALQPRRLRVAGSLDYRQQRRIRFSDRPERRGQIDVPAPAAAGGAAE